MNVQDIKNIGASTNSRQALYRENNHQCGCFWAFGAFSPEDLITDGPDNDGTRCFKE